MRIRQITKDDAPKLLKMLLSLDKETPYMMYEAGERSEDVGPVIQKIADLHQSGSLLLVADLDGQLVGFLSAERGAFRRINHTAYITLGILKDYQGQGVGSMFFATLEEWAGQNKITRLELTIMCHNISALNLYKKSGFTIEGIKRNSMCVNEKFIDEYYMAKILRLTTVSP